MEDRSPERSPVRAPEESEEEEGELHSPEVPLGSELQEDTLKRAANAVQVHIGNLGEDLHMGSSAESEGAAVPI
jgi:hypothetical protein